MLPGKRASDLKICASKDIVANVKGLMSISLMTGEDGPTFLFAWRWIDIKQSTRGTSAGLQLTCSKC